jgi:pimeloyl-ACP methyl ester carboxylesterase
MNGSQSGTAYRQSGGEKNHATIAISRPMRTARIERELIDSQSRRGRKLTAVPTIATPDGRSLCVHDAGDPTGFPVLMHHGTPMSGLPYGAHDALAREQRIRLLGYDRPGYGGSTRHAGRRVADCAADASAIADALSLERYGSWGISGGGPHVLACAALSDERLVAVASLAAVAPIGADGLDWLEGMGEENHVEFGKAREGEAALRPYLETEAAGILAAADAEDLVRVMETLLGPADRAVLTGAFAEYLLDTDRHGLAPGIDGWLDDDLAFDAEWGFDIASIDRPVLLLHGEDDRFVPVSHGRWLAARIPGVDARIDASDGHLTLIERRLREVNEWLLAHA